MNKLHNALNIAFFKNEEQHSFEEGNYGQVNYREDMGKSYCIQ